MKLVLNCTTKCNFSCPHCLRGRQKPKDLDIKLLKKVLDEANVLGFKTISITGGEPCLHSKFNEMIDLIVEKKFKFSMVTNGYYIKPYEEIIEKYKNNILFITFSIDGATAKTHNLQRCNNSFNKIISNIKKIRGKVYTRISTCLTKHNINELEDIVRLAEKLNLNEIAFLSAISTPNNKHIILSDNERINCIDRLKK